MFYISANVELLTVMNWVQWARYNYTVCRGVLRRVMKTLKIAGISPIF